MSLTALPAHRRADAVRPQDRATRGLTRERERELAARALAGNLPARNELVQSYLGLSVGYARKFARLPGHDLSEEDLAQEGHFGLMEAAERFDPFRHGTRFSTYATYWVRQRIRKAVNHQLTKRRRPARLVRGLAFDLLDLSTADDSPLEGAAKSEEFARLHRVLCTLTPSQRELLRWYATEYGTPARKSEPRNVRMNRANAARKLIQKLREKFVTEKGTANGL
jgi:RNA polymerase sigma factor (sigma-70 family)